MLTKRLPVRLTPDELALKSDQLAGRIHEGKEIDAEFAMVKAEYKSRLENNRQEIDQLAAMVRDKEERRDVQCMERRNEPERTMETVRCDTGEVIEVRGMTVAELQGDLFRKDGEVGLTKKVN